jgi:hypothetical protein
MESGSGYVTKGIFFTSNRVWDLRFYFSPSLMSLFGGVYPLLAAGIFPLSLEILP